MALKNPKYTEEGLPIVTGESLCSFSKDLEKKGVKNVVEWAKQIGKENPLVAEYINGFYSKYPEEYRLMFMLEIEGLYILLKRQAEANKLEKEFNGD